MLFVLRTNYRSKSWAKSEALGKRAMRAAIVRSSAVGVSPGGVGFCSMRADANHRKRFLSFPPPLVVRKWWYALESGEKEVVGGGS